MVDEPKTTRIPPAGSPIRDRRVTPTGVLPRQLQSWLMVGVALVIVLIILLTGHSDPPAPTRPGPASAAPTLPSPDRIGTYRQQLADRGVHALEAAPAEPPAKGARVATGATGVAAPAADDLAREAESVFADSVALSRRPAGQQPYGERRQGRSVLAHSTESAAPLSLDQMEQALARTLVQGPPAAPWRDQTAPPSVQPVAAPAVSVPTPALATRSAEPTSRSAAEYPAPGPRLPIAEATVIEAVLLNRLDGTFAGPVACLVTTPVYSRDRQRVLIPAGARVLGAASPVQGWGDSRLAVSFHRLLMPDGHSYTLDLFKGLDQVGEAGVRDDVNRHYWRVFGASIAIGALSGLAQYQTRGGLGVGSLADESRQAAGASLATSATRVLDRFLNVLPTITVREGHRIKVYLTSDLALPAYGADAPGGIR